MCRWCDEHGGPARPRRAPRVVASASMAWQLFLVDGGRIAEAARAGCAGAQVAPGRHDADDRASTASAKCSAGDHDRAHRHARAPTQPAHRRHVVPRSVSTPDTPTHARSGDPLRHTFRSIEEHGIDGHEWDGRFTGRGREPQAVRAVRQLVHEMHVPVVELRHDRGGSALDQTCLSC
jgi:hypothetical protein